MSHQDDNSACFYQRISEQLNSEIVDAYKKIIYLEDQLAAAHLAIDRIKAQMLHTPQMPHTPQTYQRIDAQVDDKQ